MADWKKNDFLGLLGETILGLYTDGERIAVEVGEARFLVWQPEGD